MSADSYKRSLTPGHPTAVMFLDETGAIASDRFFGVGCLKLDEPSILLRRLQKLRDVHHWYQEIHWNEATKGALPFYREVIDLVADCEGSTFSCYIADRFSADPIERFGSPWKAYEMLAAQLLIGSIRPYELVTVLADNYSTPDDIHFEQDVRTHVNRRLKRLAVTSVCRLDSKAADGLQVVDLLTAVAFEFRQQAGLASKRSPKAGLSAYVRERYKVGSFLRGLSEGPVRVGLYRASTRLLTSPSA